MQMRGHIAVHTTIVGLLVTTTGWTTRSADGEAHRSVPLPKSAAATATLR